MLSRLVFVFCIVNELTSFFLVNREEIKPIECTATRIKSNGSYFYVPKDLDFVEICFFTLVVPDKHTATIRINNETCKVLSGTSSNLNLICNLPGLETHFHADTYKFTFEPKSLISIKVEINEITDASCDGYVKNIHDWYGKTIRLTVNRKLQCNLQLPPDIETHFLDFRPKEKARCCGDVFVLSTSSEDRLLSISANHSICKIRNKNLKLRSKCDKTHLVVRGARYGDEVYFRLRGLERSTFSQCLGDENPVIPQYSCKKKKREQEIV